MTDRFVTRGFVGRRGSGGADLAQRVPPGQYLTTDFPVLSAGPTPRTPLDQWSFTIDGLVGESIRWSWDDFRALPARDWTVDISCVTKWTKLDTSWRGVSVDTLLEHVDIDPLGVARLSQSRRSMARRAIKSTCQQHSTHANNTRFAARRPRQAPEDNGLMVLTRLV